MGMGQALAVPEQEASLLIHAVNGLKKGHHCGSDFY